MNSRQGRRGTPRLYILDMRKTQFVELTLTYFAWENKLNRGTNQLVFMGEITCFGKPMQWKEKRSSTETEYQ